MADCQPCTALLSVRTIPSRVTGSACSERFRGKGFFEEILWWPKYSFKPHHLPIMGGWIGKAQARERPKRSTQRKSQYCTTDIIVTTFAVVVVGGRGGCEKHCLHFTKRKEKHPKPSRLFLSLCFCRFSYICWIKPTLSLTYRCI